MNNENLINWMAETVCGSRPACAGVIKISDNGRYQTSKEYRLILSYEDENEKSGTIEITPEKWAEALKSAMGA